MKECCEVRADIAASQRGILTIVLVVNLAMFLVEFGAGLLAHSTALLADSVDMLGDAIIYGFSLYVVARGPRWQARAALLKGGIMAIFGAGILFEVALKLATAAMPNQDVMGVVGVIALIGNALCLVLLWRRRGDDINMRSAWLCSRNDVVANVAVLVAAASVALTNSVCPDIAVGLLIAAMFARSSVGVIRKARHALLAAEPQTLIQPRSNA